MTFASFRLDKRVAVVTGGAQGIGRSIALGLADAGATVAIADKDVAGLHQVGQELDALGRPGVTVAMDVADTAAIQPCIDDVVKKCGRIDILVNNAGARVHKRVLDHTLEDWEYVFRTNCTGALLFSQAAARIMRAQGGGSIVNITSTFAEITNPFRVAYCASKAAAVQMTRVMAVDWAAYGIRVNAVGPGLTRTPFTIAAIERGDIPATPAQVPIGRMADADEMVGAVVYLASDAASYVTGAFLVVDGGQSINWGLGEALGR
jgi:NAD(P)-dependent dehydrogenase (short-subunit alcohol dehydrogenase family)